VLPYVRAFQQSADLPGDKMNFNTIYLICAIAGGTVLVLKFILMLVGVDQGDSPDATIDMDSGGAADGAGGGVNFLSLQSIAGFFTMFGLVGMGLLQIQAAEIWSLAGALAAGVFTAWATGMLFFQMRRLQSEGTMVITNAIGQVGNVYLTIPEKGSGVVTVTVQGAIRTLNAVSEHGQRIPTGTMVRVVAIAAGNTLVVSEQTADN
jgi:hypothetical protein